jgi:hypothetical protein
MKLHAPVEINATGGNAGFGEVLCYPWGRFGVLKSSCFYSEKSPKLFEFSKIVMLPKVAFSWFGGIAKRRDRTITRLEGWLHSSVIGGSVTLTFSGAKNTLAAREVENRG